MDVGWTLLVGFFCYIIGYLHGGRYAYTEGKIIGFLEGQQQLIKEFNDTQGYPDANAEDR